MLQKIIIPLLFISHTASFAQLTYKPVVLADGFDNGKLVRTHVEMHYTHKTATIISGYIIAHRVLEFADNTQGGMPVYTNYVERDTITTFYGTIHKGKKTGTFVSYPPGNIVHIETYKNGTQEGPFKGFYTNGALYNEGYYKKGQNIGEYRQYYANGQPAMFINKSSIEGLSYGEYYYMNGQLESKGALYHDKKVNEWVYYTYKGKLEKKEYYTNKGRLLKRL